MSEEFLAKVTVLQPSGPIDPGFGRPKPPNQVWPPVTLPPLPPEVDPPVGMWPPTINNDLPQAPIVIYPKPPKPPSISGGPATPPGIAVPPIELPPTLWPPLPPGTGIAGKALILVWVVGVGYRWLVVDGPDLWPPPPVASPK